MKKALIIIVSAILIVAAVIGLRLYSDYRKFMALDVIKVDPQLTVFLGGGGNSLVLTSEDGRQALVVDTKMRGATGELRDAVKAEDSIIVNTHFHHDHTGGNALYEKARIISGAYDRGAWAEAAGKNRYPDITLKPGEEKELKIGSETVLLRNMGRAHTANDIVAYLKNRKFLATGDLVFLEVHPAILAKSGANVGLWVKVLEDLPKRYDIQKLMPGHGRLSDRTALTVMRDYFTSIRDAVGNSEKLDALRKKYSGYFSITGITGFDKTAAFIEKEKKGEDR